MATFKHVVRSAKSAKLAFRLCSLVNARRYSADSSVLSISSYFQDLSGFDSEKCDVYANKVASDRLLRRYHTMGKQSAELYLTKELLHVKDLSCQKILDAVSSMLDGSWAPVGHDITSRDDSQGKVDLMMSLVGAIHLSEGSEAANQIMRHCLKGLIAAADFDIMAKLRHPKLMLTLIGSMRQMEFKTSVDANEDGSFRAEVTCDEAVMAKASHPSDPKVALSNACVQALQEHFMSDVVAISLPDENELKLEDEICLGFDMESTRIVKLNIDEDDSLGLFLRGGKEVKLRNRDYKEFHCITPVYISDMLEESEAFQLKQLRKGDVILAINGRSLKGMSHQKVINILKTYRGKLTLTVKYDKDSMLRDQFALNFKNRLKTSFKTSILADRWKAWHVAQAKKDPSAYLPYAE